MMRSKSTYAEQFVDWLVEEGYTHCFFLAGGNIMHLLDAARIRLHCIPVVHEVSAGIAAEYFNASRNHKSGKAFALVTAGPGVTNILTAMAGAFLESRELLVIAGQVKSSDLSAPPLRQRGVQEIDGIALAKPVSTSVLQIDHPIPRSQVVAAIRSGTVGRSGPTFIEFCLDAQAGEPLIVESAEERPAQTSTKTVQFSDLQAARELLRHSERPLVLLGGGIPHSSGPSLVAALREVGIPVATSWNALDRVDASDTIYFGRPDTWGMRWSNILIQQADLIIAAGVRLSLQQTGFNWQSFAPLAKIIHVNLDRAELEKGHPKVDLAIEADATDFVLRLAQSEESSHKWLHWLEFGREVRKLLPLDDTANETRAGFVSPYRFAQWLSNYMTPSDVLVPCSSGGASTVLMQAFEQKAGQRVLNNKALASMGYGLAGAIGAAISNPGRRIMHVEGDGGFAQNLQELGTVSAHQLSIKTFIFANEGYASIRMTQRNYFDGAWIGCDQTTGLVLPNWEILFSAFDIPSRVVRAEDLDSLSSDPWLNAAGPAAFVISVDPDQTYYPKISSRVLASGSMESNPLHLMTPPLEPDLQAKVMPYLMPNFGGSS